MFRTLLYAALTTISGAVAVSANDTENASFVKPDGSGIFQSWSGETALELHLSDRVPFRVFTLDDPPRLVVDFRDLDWSALVPSDLIDSDTVFETVYFGAIDQGWSRFVGTLKKTALPQDIAMTPNQNADGATLRIVLSDAAPQDFAAQSGVPENTLWAQEIDTTQPAPIADDRFVVALDPGHGGIDPGAERDGVSEKNLMLDLAQELRAALMSRGDVDVFLTREHDVFVSLQSRVAQAHRAGADLFLSLHADALSEGGAQGATVYLLSREASDTATAYLVARHDRADVIAGADLRGADDTIATVLLDLARQETEPRSQALAGYLVKGLEKSGAPMNSRPLRQAGFSVLKSADIPSVLLEVGFLSNERDLQNIRTPQWRENVVNAIADAILVWRDSDAAKRDQTRD